jgi:hypothetical protein
MNEDASLVVAMTARLDKASLAELAQLVRNGLEE